MAFSLGTVVWTGIAAYAAARIFYRPSRAVVQEGTLVGCPATEKCNPTVQIRTVAGAPVYSVASGRVVAVAPGSVSIVPNREAVLLRYAGLASVLVAPGASVGMGQAIGTATASPVGFGVSAIGQGGALSPLEPASWLASRGLRVTSSAGGDAWCAQGRRLVVPQAVLKCGMRLPEPSGFALLPVSVQVE